MNKVAVIRICGGVGNQLFIYNYSIYLKHQYPRIKILYDVSPYYSIFIKKRNNFVKKYSLYFVLDKYISLNIINITLGKILYKIGKINRNILKISIFPILTIEDEIENNNIYNKYHILLISGHFISRKYMEYYNIIKIILKEKDIKHLSEILNSQSVSIHIRGKQYINDRIIKLNYAIIEEGYYRKAIDVILNKLEKPIFYIFSNDIKYAKEICNKLSIKANYIENNQDYIDFYLMKNCKNNILINSTFSYWAAILNENDKKIVICPSKWAGNNINKLEYDKLPLNEWIKIDNQ